MLDTRKIDLFTNPESFLKLVNPLLFDRTFNEWDAKSVNLVISDLLWEHIMTSVADKTNFAKLLDTSKKVGFKIGTKLLGIHSSRIMFLIEVLTKDTVRVAMGAVAQNGEFNFVVSGDVVLFPEDKPDKWYSSKNPIVSDKYKYLESDKMNEFCTGLISKATAAYVYLSLVETELIVVQSKEKFKAKKFSGFKNQQRIPVTVADLSWSKEYLAVIPIGVTGHFRNARVGIGRIDRKLIYIGPYIKSFHQKSKKDRVLK